jgi:hypothetical protein
VDTGAECVGVKSIMPALLLSGELMVGVLTDSSLRADGETVTVATKQKFNEDWIAPRAHGPLGESGPRTPRYHHVTLGSPLLLTFRGNRLETLFLNCYAQLSLVSSLLVPNLASGNSS